MFNTTTLEKAIWGVIIALAVFIGTALHGTAPVSHTTGAIGVTQSYNYFATSTSGTAGLMGTPGVLHSVVINNALSGTQHGTTTIYDLATTTPYCPAPAIPVPASGATSSIVAVIGAGAAEGTYFYDVALQHGLCVVTSGNMNITTTWSR